MPTLKELQRKSAKIVLLSHFGRPEGKPDPRYSLKPVAKELGALMGQPVAFAEDCIGPKAEAAVKQLMPGQILILENTRFHPGEEANDDLSPRRSHRLAIFTSMTLFRFPTARMPRPKAL